MKYMLYNMRPIVTLMNPKALSTDTLQISEFVMKIEKLAVILYGGLRKNLSVFISTECTT